MHFLGEFVLSGGAGFFLATDLSLYLCSTLAQNFGNHEARDCEKDIGESDGSLLWYHVCFSGL